MNYFLGVFGTWQVIFLLVIVAGIVVSIVAVFSSRAKYKSKAQTLSSVIDSNMKSPDVKRIDDEEKFNKLERLNKLKQDGALTDEEFNREKARILG